MASVYQIVFSMQNAKQLVGCKSSRVKDNVLIFIFYTQVVFTNKKTVHIDSVILSSNNKNTGQLNK